MAARLILQTKISIVIVYTRNFARPQMRRVRILIIQIVTVIVFQSLIRHGTSFIGIGYPLR